MKLELFGDKLYVKLDPIEEGKVGSIIIPGVHREVSRLGTIREVGPDVTRVKVGDRILVQYYSGVTVERLELSERGDTPDAHRIMVESEILARITE